jgi:hypothetical protein
MCRYANTHGHFVEGIPLFRWPLIEKIDGVPNGSNFDDRELPILHENRVVEKLIIHLILRLLWRSCCRASQRI